MDVLQLKEIFDILDINFFTGVPDSLLKPLCNYLMNTYGVSKKHIIAVNEGNAAAIAAGHHLSTGEIPCIYLQNSGLGNILNPVVSLLNNKVYGIPCLLIVGWRGEPNIHDEPQHIFQGEITLELLKVMDIDYMVIDKNTQINELKNNIAKFKLNLSEGKSLALVIKKDGLSYNEKVKYENKILMVREDIINSIINVSEGDIIVSTTGKTSRELFEVREQKGQSHKYDFLTVGSMGHSSSIALKIALNKPNTRIWCLDGDGAALMHMGSMAIIGSNSLSNYLHVIINNGAHESVGGLPTIANNINFEKIALGCGYKLYYHAKNINELQIILSEIKSKQGPILLEIESAIYSRKNLGRPTTTPIENKLCFMEYLKECD